MGEGLKSKDRAVQQHRFVERESGSWALSASEQWVECEEEKVPIEKKRIEKVSLDDFLHR